MARHLQGYGLTWQDMEAMCRAGVPQYCRPGAAPVPAPAPAPAPAAVRSPDPDTWSVIGEDATGRAPIIPAGWNTRNQARAIEAAVAPVTVRDFESFSEGGPVLKAEPVSSSSATPAPSAAGGLGLAAVIALLLFGS